MTDEELIRSFAEMRWNDPVPAGGEKEIVRRVERLVELGVMLEPQGTDSFTDVVARARDECRARLGLDGPAG